MLVAFSEKKFSEIFCQFLVILQLDFTCAKSAAKTLNHYPSSLWATTSKSTIKDIRTTPGVIVELKVVFVH